MQTRALLEAALNNKYNKGLDPRPEIMIPLVATDTEFKHQEGLIKAAAARVFAERSGQHVDFKIGKFVVCNLDR